MRVIHLQNSKKWYYPLRSLSNSWKESTLSYLVVILALTLVLVIHEGGHAYLMRKHGVKIKNVGIGLPLIPISLIKIKIGSSTTFHLHPFLFGAYVEPENEEDIKNFFPDKEWQILSIEYETRQDILKKVTENFHASWRVIVEKK
mgnify:CR=1 FL=1